MWRSSSLEEWERRKSYLIRSLFEDLPILSPILEGQEPASLTSPINFLNRSESPLPELIIEVEPRKPNLHDDPEELYDELAKEMRRLYRKDFLDKDSSSSSPDSHSCSESLNRRRIYDYISDESDKSQTDYYATDHQEHRDMDSLTHTEISISKESSESIPIESETVTAEVDIHSQNYEIHHMHRQSDEDMINTSKSTIVLDLSDGGDGVTDEEERPDPKSFAEKTGASSNDNSFESSVYSTNASPELMRQQQPFRSLETPPRFAVSKSNSSVSRTVRLSMEVDSKEDSENINISNQEIKIPESFLNKTPLFLSSTPIRKRTSSSCTSSSRIRGLKRRLVSYSSLSSFASVANKAAQTSFPDCEMDEGFHWSKFFVGIPSIYNVCFCRDHVCAM